MFTSNTGSLTGSSKNSLDGAGSVLADTDSEALEKFGATLAHELRGPLSAAVNGIHLLRVSRSREDHDWAIAMMDRQLTQLRNLIDDLMDVGRLSANKVSIVRDRVDLRKLVDDLLDCTSNQFAAGGRNISVECDPSLPEVEGDRPRLAQVFANLLSNSVKFTPPEGHIAVRLARSGEMAEVSVCDDGIGIPPEELPHVFDMFRQQRAESRRGAGLGIGLSIVRSIVRLHGGSVEAFSEGPGRGSVFTVRLPLVRGDSAARQ